MNNEFSNNPFVALQNKLLPKNNSKVNKKNIVKVQPEAATVLCNELEDDSSLFLQAVHNAKPSKKHHGRVHLAEHEQFSKLNSEKKKKVQKITPIKTTQEKNIQSHTLMDDDSTFMQAMHEVAPLAGKGRDVVPEVKPIPQKKVELSYQNLIESNVEFALALKGEYLEGHVLGLDEDIMHGLRSGRYSPEANIDLHGLNALQAYNSLVSFFRGAWYKGLRTVLVIPGRGKNSLNGFGVLRDKLQTWLTQEPFKRVILAFCTARPVDGGPGSVYVLLRKYKKKGKIHWERMPSDPDLF